MNRKKPNINPNQLKLSAEAEVNEDIDKEPSQAFLDSPNFDYQGFYELLIEEGYSKDDAIKTVELAESMERADSEPGASIRVDARTFAASAIMAYFNQANKGIGLSKSRGITDFDARYDDPDRVMSKMGDKEKDLYIGFKQAIDTLFNEEDLIRSGFSQQEIAEQKENYVRNIYYHFGPGNAYAPDRTKAVNKLKRADKKRKKLAKGP